MPTRTFRTKLLLAFVTLVGLMIAVAFLSLRTSSEARFHLERSRLAHAVLGEHLALRADTLALVNDLVAGPAAGRSGHRAHAAVGVRLSGVRDAIVAELAFLAATTEGRSEREELRALAALEEEVRRAVAALEAVGKLVRQDERREASLSFGRILDEQIDGRLATLLRTVIAEETREVARSDRAALAVLRQGDGLVVLGAVAALAVGIGTLVLIQRRAGAPLDRAELEAAVAARTEELRRAHAALSQAARIRRRFLADVSHELRTSVTVIRGESEIALRGREKSAGDYRLALERVLEHARALCRLVDDLLFVARAESRAVRLARQPVDLAALLRAVCRERTVPARDAGVVIELREHAGASALPGDPGKLRQLFLMLIDDALGSSPPGRGVTVDLSPAPCGFTVRVAGGAIAQDGLDTVSERSCRGSRPPGPTGRGSSLGLPVAEAIVEAHGGEIRVESGPDHGTAVTVLLPAHDPMRATA